jgi:hypothetical protein
MKRDNLITINLVMQHLKVQVVKALEDLTPPLFQIFLKIFLATLVVEVLAEDQVIEEMTLDMI